MTPGFIAEEYPNVFETENNDASCCDSRLYEHGLLRPGRRESASPGLYRPQRHLRRPVLEGSLAGGGRYHAAGGIKGEKIVLVQGDDACEPKQAVAVANRLVDEAKVSAVVGHFCSSSTMPASEVYDEADPDHYPGSTNPQITERGMKDLFRMCGRDDQQGAIAANYMLDVLKAKKIAVIHDKDTYGQGLADATRAALAKRGTKEVLYEGLSRGEKTLTPR